MYFILYVFKVRYETQLGLNTSNLPREKWDTWDPTLISEVWLHLFSLLSQYLDSWKFCSIKHLFVNSPNLSWTFSIQWQCQKYKVSPSFYFHVPRNVFPFYCNPPSIYSPFLVSDRGALFVIRVPYSIYSSMYLVFCQQKCV